MEFFEIESARRGYLLSRIKLHSVKSSTGCIEWVGAKTKGGYGLIRFAKTLGEGYQPSTTVHRAYFMAFYDMVLRRDQHVLHKCDNPACVNINHLFLGTAKENSQDCISKGRRAKSYKLTTRQYVFTDEEILQIKNAKGLLREVSEHFGVSVGYISKLRNGLAKTLVKETI